MNPAETFAMYKYGKSARHDESDSKDSDDDSLHERAAMNLLDIRNPNRWDPNRSDESGAALGLEQAGDQCSRSGDGSVTKIYQPKFQQVYRQYCESLKQPVAISKHLMSVCLEHLIPFSCWARESAARSAWIRETLDDNSDLRPEVRNGLSMILIYSMSAAKAELTEDADMFGILQETEMGMGIVNKTSLKIYNDPFNYFNFLKSSISGLIDAGKVPENERQNQPKKAKRQAENKEEICAFEQLRTMLERMLNRGENSLVRAKIQQISNVWHQRQKSIRNNRFVTALAVALGSAPTLLNEPLLSDPIPEKSAMIPNTSLPAVLLSSSSTAAITATTTTNSGGGSGSDSNGGMDAICEPPAKMPRLNVSRSSFIPAFRFERIASKEWEFQESKVFNMEALVHSNNGTFYLVDEGKLLAAVEGNRLKSSSTGIISLQAELQQCGALVTSWPKADLPHMLDFLEAWASQDQESSLLGLWQKRNRDSHLHAASVTTLVTASLSSPVWKNGQNSSSGSGSGITASATSTSTCATTTGPFAGSMSSTGMLVYEIVMQVGIVLRQNDALGLDEDCWRILYLRDLEDSSSTLGDLLKRFFPQLRLAENKWKGTTVVVKYLAHSIAPPLVQFPKQEALSMYQTIGTLDEQATNVLWRLDTSVTFHDIILQVRQWS